MHIEFSITLQDYVVCPSGLTFEGRFHNIKPRLRFSLDKFQTYIEQKTVKGNKSLKTKKFFTQSLEFSLLIENQNESSSPNKPFRPTHFPIFHWKCKPTSTRTTTRTTSNKSKSKSKPKQISTCVESGRWKTRWTCTCTEFSRYPQRYKYFNHNSSNQNSFSIYLSIYLSFFVSLSSYFTLDWIKIF